MILIPFFCSVSGFFYFKYLNFFLETKIALARISFLCVWGPDSVDFCFCFFCFFFSFHTNLERKMNAPSMETAWQQMSYTEQQCNRKMVSRNCTLTSPSKKDTQIITRHCCWHSWHTLLAWSQMTPDNWT